MQEGKLVLPSYTHPCIYGAWREAVLPGLLENVVI